MATVSAEHPVVDDDARAEPIRRDVRPDGGDLAGDLMTEDSTGPVPWNTAGAREYIVMADASGANMHEHVGATRLGPLDLADLEHLGRPKIAERHGLHRRHQHSLSCC